MIQVNRDTVSMTVMRRLTSLLVILIIRIGRILSERIVRPRRG